MSTFYLKTGDLLPVIRSTLSDADDAFDLASATGVAFVMKPYGSGEVKVDAAAAIDDAEAREVSYVWQEGDTDTPGVYRAEWRVTYAEGVVTFPNGSYDVVHIRGALGA